MSREIIIMLGIPVDNLTMDETMERILDLVDAFAQDQRPRMVATVNVDFLVNTLKWFSIQPKHPELLNILRRASLLTADGMPLVWTSKIIGTPLRERVTGADLVPRLAKEAAQHKKSIYFLGGKGDVGRRAADLLKKENPELIIAGTDSPFVHIEGEKLFDTDKDDAEIVERINRSNADILLIGFGNPKQEVWFHRNRLKLNVAVTIGIGGTFEFITGSVARAPVWMQKSGLEWIFRITQAPKRLWKRYFIGVFKFSLMILPTILYFKFQRLFIRNNQRNLKQPVVNPQNKEFDRESKFSNQVIQMPNPLDAATTEAIGAEIDKNLSIRANTILDFKAVDFIDSSGLGFVMRLWRKAEEDKKGFYLTGIKPSVKRVFELSRVIDLFEKSIFANSEDAFAQIQSQGDLPQFYYLTTAKDNYVLLNLFGVLDAAQMDDFNMAEVLEQLNGKDCILDLSGITFVDSSGLQFFLKIYRYSMKRNKKSLLFGLQTNVLQMFNITKLNHLFDTFDDLNDAEQALKK